MSVALEVRGLRRTYGPRVAVDSLDLSVTEGSVYGFLGPNGAGKTTAMRCILQLIRPDAGHVAIFGETDPVKQRTHVGALIETPRFYEWMSGKANLEIACAYAGLDHNEVVGEALARVGLQDRGEDQVGGYSLGMKQRLGIARALLGKPKLLLLDEPTNGLDPQGMKDVRDLIAGLAADQDVTIFISSHLLYEIQAVATRVGIIRRGHLVAEGEVQELIAGGDEVEVEVGSPDLNRLREAIDLISGAEWTGAGPDRRQVVKLAHIDVPTFNRQLVEHGVPVSELMTRGRTLEDLFLELVGGTEI